MYFQKPLSDVCMSFTTFSFIKRALKTLGNSVRKIEIVLHLYIVRKNIAHENGALFIRRSSKIDLKVANSKKHFGTEPRNGHETEHHCLNTRMKTSFSSLLVCNFDHAIRSRAIFLNVCNISTNPRCVPRWNNILEHCDFSKFSLNFFRKFFKIRRYNISMISINCC